MGNYFSSQKSCTEKQDNFKEVLIIDENVEKWKRLKEEEDDELFRLKEEEDAEFFNRNLEKARKAFTEGIELDGICASYRALLYSERWAAHLDDKKYEAALEDAKKVIELCPEWYDGYYMVGKVYESIGFLKKAEKYFIKADEIADEILARERGPGGEEVEDD